MRYAVRLVAAALLAAASGAVTAGPPAYAAGACTGSTGVTVVVDFNSLGGGVPQACVTGGGGDSASSLFPAAGFALRYAQRQPGFVCRVNEVPQSDPCVNTAPADAFWGLWWSPGDGSWRFSTLGTGSLTVPDGGFVAFSWDDVGGSAPPSASAKRAAPPPAEPSQPPAGGTNGGGGGPADGGGDGSGADGSGVDGSPGGTGSAPPAGAPSTTPTDSPDIRERPGRDRERRRGDRKADGNGGTPGTTESPTAAVPDDGPTSESGTQVADPGDTDDGLPGWVAPLLIGVLFAGAGVVLYLRRRPTTS